MLNLDAGGVIGTNDDLYYQSAVRNNHIFSEHSQSQWLSLLGSRDPAIPHRRGTSSVNLFTGCANR